MQENDHDTGWLDALLNDFGSGNDKEEEETEDMSFPIEEDEEDIRKADEMYDRQLRYERELIGYPEESPYKIFRHDFMRDGYLPVKVVKDEAKDYLPFTLEAIAEEMVEGAYTQGKRNIILNHRLFCEIWYKRKHYVYAGYILTPEGKIDADTFKSEIVKVLLLMKTELQNLDVVASHLYYTYVSGYKMDAYQTTNLIPFKNGDLELDRDERGFTFYEGRKSPVPYRFEYNFKNIPNCFEPEFPNFAKWREDLFDEDDFYSLKQLLGYLLLPNNEAQEAFFIIGKAGSGKSILTNTIIPKMLGDACFPMSIGQFFNDKFQMASCEGKLCMVDDDIGETKFTQEDSGRFKNFVTAEKIKIEHKYCNPTSIINSARIVCAGNHMINSADKTDGFTRRLHPIYVKPRSLSEVDRTLPKKIASEIESIVLWALEGLLEVMKNGGVPYMSYKTHDNFESYAENQKWEEQFIRECFEYKGNTVTYSHDVRDILSDWLKENSEVTDDGTLEQKFRRVCKWLKDEGTDKYGYSYKRGIRKGDNYNARGFVNMAPKKQMNKTVLFTDESGKVKLKISKKG